LNNDKKTKAALLSILSNTFLITLKVIAGILSGSVSILSEAIHSGIDLIASTIAFISVRASAKPADKEHPYGHGKIENVSGVVEALLIFIAAVLIVSQSVGKLLHPIMISQTTLAIAVMLLSAVSNFTVSKILAKVAKEEDSVALEADALHLQTDVYTSLSVAAGLAVIHFTGIALLDPLIAILVALLIVKEAWQLCRKAFSPLLDASLDERDEQIITEVFGLYADQIRSFHTLRTRKVGNIRHIDVHLSIDGNTQLAQAHRLTEEIVQTIEQRLKNTNVTIHLDPD
jgi:cation diffusion facilitator family transporter